MISDRQLRILDYIISEYVKTAKPVGSASVAKEGGFDLSPATIRNDMNDLEESGLLAQLHTSGGRVPTDNAYRYFVNNIVENYELVPKAKDKVKIESAIHKSGNDPREVNKNIAKTLSELSDNLVITKVDEADNFVKVGLSSLFNMPEFREFDRAFRLTNFFDEFDEIFEQLEKRMFAEVNRVVPEIRIFIGNESPMRASSDETIMCARYPLPGNIAGSLTLIGPTRMDYERNLSLIKYTVYCLNKNNN
jgi:heat-inducible transcriptional repressor